MAKAKPILNSQAVKCEVLDHEPEAASPPRSADAVYREIEALAEAYVERSAGVLTKSQALDRVLETRPDLLAEYREARSLASGQH